MVNIERRAKHDLALFLVEHRDRYSDLARYRSNRAHFQTLVRGLLPESWVMGEGVGMWCAAHPPVDEIPDAGFKIHLSAASDSARALLSAVVPILVEEGEAFKF